MRSLLARRYGLVGWTAERLEGPHENRLDLIRDDRGTEVGIVEYVGIRRRGGGCTYGWRPLHSGWTARQLKDKGDAVKALRRARHTEGEGE